MDVTFAVRDHVMPRDIYGRVQPHMHTQCVRYFCFERIEKYARELYTVQVTLRGLEGEE